MLLFVVNVEQLGTDLAFFDVASAIGEVAGHFARREELQAVLAGLFGLHFK